MISIKKYNGGRVIMPSVSSVFLIRYPGGQPHFTRDIWDANGSPTNLALGDGWTSIADFTFRDTNLEKIKIPTSITYIGHCAFQNTHKLVSVTFNPGSLLNTIETYAFKDAKELTTIEIPSGVEKIPLNAFAGDIKLTSVIFDVEHSQLKTIQAGAFSSTDLHSLYLPRSLRSISTFAFNGNSNLTEIHMYPNVLERLNADDLNTQAHFGMNSFDDNNLFFGINHPVNIIPLQNTRGGRRKIRSRTRKSSTRRRRRYKHKSRRRRTIKRK